METTTATSKRFNNRDRKGRFHAIIHIDSVDTMIDDEAGIAHANHECREIVGAETIVARGAHEGWVCTVCTNVSALMGAFMEFQMTKGTMPKNTPLTCACCGETKKARKFPTMAGFAGIKVRGRNCRSCRDAGASGSTFVEFDGIHQAA